MLHCVLRVIVALNCNYCDDITILSGDVVKALGGKPGP